MRPIKQKNAGVDGQRDVGRFALLLVILIATIALLSLVGIPRQTDDTGIGVRILVTLLAVGGLFATLRVTRVTRRSRRWFVASVAIFSVVAIAVSMISSGPIDRLLSLVWVGLVIISPALVLREVLSSDKVNAQTILGAIGVYLLIGIAFTFVVIAMEGWGGFFETTPRSTSYVYFSFVTITTLGYGDLAPFTDEARLVSVTAAVMSQMYLVIVVARLVAIWSKTQVPAESD